MAGGIKRQFRTNAQAQTDGAWIALEPNTDGTIPRFKLARMHPVNKTFQKAQAEFIASGEAKRNAGSFNEAENEQRGREIFVDTILRDWENIQPDDDGKSIKFSRENALTLLSNPEFADLEMFLVRTSQDRERFAAANFEDAAKN